MISKKYFPLIILLTITILFVFLVFHTQAQYKNQEKIPGAQPTDKFDQYLKDIIGFGFAVIGILAMFMLCVGAYQYLMAAGNLAKVESAKETIASALLGLALGLCAWVILKTINPDLVKMELKSSSNTGGGTKPPPA